MATEICVNIGSGDVLLPEPMLTNHQSFLVAFTSGQFHKNAQDICPWHAFENYYFHITVICLGGYWVNFVPHHINNGYEYNYLMDLLQTYTNPCVTENYIFSFYFYFSLMIYSFSLYSHIKRHSKICATNKNISIYHASLLHVCYFSLSYF